MFLVKLVAKNIEIIFDNKTIKFNDITESKEKVIEEEINSYLVSFNIEKMAIKASNKFELNGNQYALVLMWVTTQLLLDETKINTAILKENLTNIYNKIQELTISDTIITTPIYQTTFQKIQQFVSLIDISNNEMITPIIYHDLTDNIINSNLSIYFDEHDIDNFVFDNPKPITSNNNAKQSISLNGSFDDIKEREIDDGPQVHQSIVKSNIHTTIPQDIEQQPLASYNENAGSTKNTNLINVQIIESQLSKSAAEQIDELGNLDNIGDFIFDKPQPTNDSLETQTNDKPYVFQGAIENNIYPSFIQDNALPRLEGFNIIEDVHSTSAQDNERQLPGSVENNIHSTPTQAVESHHTEDFIEDGIYSTPEQENEPPFPEGVENNTHLIFTQNNELQPLEGFNKEDAHSTSAQDSEQQFLEDIENNIHQTFTQAIEPQSIEDGIYFTSEQESEQQFPEDIENNIYPTLIQNVESHHTEDLIEDGAHSISTQDLERQFPESVGNNIYSTSTQDIESHYTEVFIEDDVYSTSLQDSERQFPESPESNIHPTSTQVVEPHSIEDFIENDIHSASAQGSERQFPESPESNIYPTSTQVVEPHSIEDFIENDIHSTSTQGSERQLPEGNESQPYNNADQITQSELTLKNQAEQNAVQLLENLYQSLRSVKGSSRYCHYDPGFFARTKYKINNTTVKCGRTMFDILNLIFNENGSLKFNSAVTALETLQNNFKEAVSKGKNHYEDYTNIAQREKMFNLLKAIEKDIMTPRDQNGDPYFILNGGGHSVTYSLEGGKPYTIKLPRHAYQMHQLIENAIKGKISIRHALDNIYTITDVESSKIVTGPLRREESTRLTYEKYAQWIRNAFPQIYTNSRLSRNNQPL